MDQQKDGFAANWRNVRSESH